MRWATLTYYISTLRCFTPLQQQQTRATVETIQPRNMPTFQQLACHIEQAGSNLKLREYGTTYGDGFVETFVAIPDEPRGFSIHLTSSAYIAPGLAIFVYVDGVYQCNRNRRGQEIPDKDTPLEGSFVEFRVRQKEEKRFDGTFIGRSWNFEKLNVGT